MTESIDEIGALTPISPEAPCGPDLDAEGDAEFMNFMAATEGQLPAAFFSFDRKSIDFTAALAGGEKLLARTHDIRLLVLLAKLAILDRDLGGFAHRLATLAQLLGDYWDDVHPRGEDGDFSVRIAQLSTLDDGPVVIFPLQYTTLAETQRDGVLTFRAQMVAAGEANPRESENLPNAAAIEKILLNCEMPRLAETFKALQQIKASIAQIGVILTERVGFEQTLSFDALSPLVDRMVSFIHAALVRRDPTIAPAAPVEEGSPDSPAVQPSGATPEFASLADVDAALAAALGYFEKMEPSSAAVLLIGQARQLLGKNLYEVMKVLTPSYADKARIFVGVDAAFTILVSSIPANEAEGALFDRQEMAPASSRAAALTLIDGVAAHFRLVEPSSPLPYLLDRANALATRDFLTLMKDILSEEALTNLKRDE
jgi:type VI secretion system protein ImpA